MFLRIFPDSMPLALISGVISGIGASVTLLVIRSWIYYESDQDKSAKEALVSSRYTIMQIATLLAIMGSGWIISLFHSSNTVYLVLIILAAIFMGSLAFTNNIPTGRIQKKKNSMFVPLPSNKVASLLLFLLVLLLGLTNALIDPILPAILRSSGLKVSMVTVWTTIFSILTVIASLIYQRIHFNMSAGKTFIVNEVIVGVIMIIASFEFSKGLYISLIAYAIMSIGIAGFFIFKELMEYDMFPKEESFLYLGITQSGFLVGDAVGSPVGTLVFQHQGTRTLMLIFGISTIVCGISYGLFYRYMKQKGI